VACAKDKPLPICFVRIEGERVVPITIPREIVATLPRGSGNAEVEEEHPFRLKANTLVRYLKAAAAECHCNVKRIAIDAPAAPPRNGRRNSERELERAKIPCIPTPDVATWHMILRKCRRHLKCGKPLNRLPHANRIWMLYGFRIFAALRASGIEAIEVYPQAIVRTLIRGACPHKSTPQGYERQLRVIARRTGWRPRELERALAAASAGSRHDRLDAFMAAWVASLEPRDRVAFGNERDPRDAIWVPKKTA
jgi:predicted nuclease with RNAse H fold